MDPVGETAQPAAPADDPPAVAAEHDVDAVAAKPGALVEAVYRPARKRDHTEHLEQGSLRWSTAERQLEQDRLRDLEAPEAAHLRRHAQAEVPATGGPGDGDERGLGRADSGEQRASGERVGPGASPPPAPERQRKAGHAGPAPTPQPHPRERA